MNVTSRIQLRVPQACYFSHFLSSKEKDESEKAENGGFKRKKRGNNILISFIKCPHDSYFHM